MAEYIPALNRLTSAETGSCFGDYLDDLHLVSKNALGKNMFGAFLKNSIEEHIDKLVLSSCKALETSGEPITLLQLQTVIDDCNVDCEKYQDEKVHRAIRQIET